VYAIKEGTPALTVGQKDNTMKTNANILLSFLGAFLVLLSCACDPCEDNPGTVRVDTNDGSAPVLVWQVTTFANTPSGPISSLELIFGTDETISMNTNERMEVRLVGEDTESGITWLDIQGGFGYTCANPGQAVVFDGIIPGDRLFFPLAESVCATVEAAYPDFIIDATSLCSGNFPNLSNGGYQFNGSGSNGNDILSLSTLTVNIFPATI